MAYILYITHVHNLDDVSRLLIFGWKTKTINFQTAIFRQVNKDKMAAHHDALEFPDGRTVLLTLLCEGQEATVLQLPAQPRTDEEAREQERVSYVG